MFECKFDCECVLECECVFECELECKLECEVVIFCTELKEGLTRVGSDLLGSLRTVWQSFSQLPAPALVEGNDMATAACTAEEMESESLNSTLFCVCVCVRILDDICLGLGWYCGLLGI